MALPIKVKCKKCGREAKSDEFILDPVYRIMVCQQCVKERKMADYAARKQKSLEELKAKQEQAQVQEKRTRPAGWDAEDAEIERAYKAKQGQVSKIVPIDGSRVRYTCTKCKYQFIVDVDRKHPPRCSYCGTPVQGI